jgi:tryptophan-rich sensory protein
MDAVPVGSRGRSALALAVSGLLTAGAAALGAAVARPAVDSDWYATLDKPRWQPPAAAFGPAWGVLYAAQSVAAWLVWRSDPADGPDGGAALRLYGAQLALNTAWTLLFFGARSIGLAVVEIAVLWIAIAATINSFRHRSPLAAWLLVPYLAWVTFATALNVAIWRRNRAR